MLHGYLVLNLYNFHADFEYAVKLKSETKIVYIKEGAIY